MNFGVSVFQKKKRACGGAQQPRSAPDAQSTDIKRSSPKMRLVSKLTHTCDPLSNMALPEHQ